MGKIGLKLLSIMLKKNVVYIKFTVHEGNVGGPSGLVGKANGVSATEKDK